MKGVVLAGGSGSRLAPLTDVTNKHLLAVYNKPMAFYPIQTLIDAGIDEIMIVTSPEHAGSFLRLLGSGESFGAKFTYKVQEGGSLGIAHALGLVREFANGDDLAVILGDNIFEDNFKKAFDSFEGGAMIFLKEVSDASRFGVAEVVDGKVVGIEEKPSRPKSNFAQTGLYIYDKRVFEIIDGLDYSARGELEITDVNNQYIDWGSLNASFIDGDWTDAGTFESLYKANILARDIALKKFGSDRERGGIKKTSTESREISESSRIRSS